MKEKVLNVDIHVTYFLDKVRCKRKKNGLQANNNEIPVSLCSYVKCQVDQVVLSLLPRPTKLPGK